MAGLQPDDLAPAGDVITDVDRERAGLYLALLDSALEGLDWRALGMRHFRWAGGTDEAHVRDVVESHLRRAIWMRDVGYRGLLGP
jgi:hypothetical protein